MVPEIRLRQLNDAPLRTDRPMVLYWMVANRRTRFNFSLQRAVEHAEQLRKPLVILEAIRAGYRWASDRLHQFAIDGMRDNAAEAGRAGITYMGYVEPLPGAGTGLLDALAAHASVVVTDDFPSFFIPRMTAAAAARLDVRVEAVDGNGLLPMRAVETVYPSAYAFRRALQQRLPAHLGGLPDGDPLAGVGGARFVMPAEISSRWPDLFSWEKAGGTIEALPIDHAVRPALQRGGARAARARLAEFLSNDLVRYGDLRNQPETDVTSRLSPYLHWGHLSVHEIFQQLAAQEGWVGVTASRATGAREGWWGMSGPAEAFLDELVTWRELGFNMSSRRDDSERFESLPAWAQRTLGDHEEDPRDPCYGLAEFESAATHDPLWNAAQRQLVREGRIHNYLRMLWGKKILQWSASPRAALDIMIELNNKYALDGRNPNSSSGIFWVLGRYDRPWAPARPIFGTIRYMSSENTARKVRVREYVRRYSGETGLF